MAINDVCDIVFETTFHEADETGTGIINSILEAATHNGGTRVDSESAEVSHRAHYLSLDPVIHLVFLEKSLQIKYW